MEDTSFLASGDYIVPVFSLKNNQQWISFNSTSLSIPSDALLWINARSYPKNDPPQGILSVMDNQHQAGWYSASRPWRGFNPRAELDGGAEDPIAWVFDSAPIACLDQMVSAPHPDDAQVYAGCFLNDKWVERAISVSTRLNCICAVAAANSYFYNEAPGSPMGKLPEPVETDALARLQTSDADASRVATATRHAIMDHLGFMSWIGSMTTSWRPSLSDGDRDYLDSLCLDERPARGALFKLSTDYQQSNFEYWLRHKVPFHLLWTDEEDKDGRFVRYSPRYIETICSLRAQKDGEEVNEYELYFYDEVKADLDRYDRFFQDRYSEHRGYVTTRFQTDYEYYIVDFLLWGARPLQNWMEIRVCAERFKCVRTRKLNGYLVTFFRQSPLRVDEPWHLRSRPLVHPWPLEQFATAEFGIPVDEGALYMEDTVVVREMRKSQWAPGEGRSFSPYDGRRTNTGMTAQMWDEHRHRIASRARNGSSPDSSHQFIPARGEVGVSSGAEWRDPDHRPSLEERMGLSSSRHSRTGPGSVQLDGVEVYSRRGSLAREFTPRQRNARSVSPSARGRTREPRRSPIQRAASLDSDRESGEMDATNAEDRDEARRLWNLQEDEGDRRSPSFQEEYNGSVANGSEPEEFEDAHERIPSAPDADHSIHGYYAPFDAQLDVTSDFLPREPIFVSETEARAVLQSEMSKVTETQPSQRMLTGLHWNRDWLDKAVFVFKDPRTHLRLKLLANCYHDADDITDILNMAWRFGYKFHLFIPMEDAVKFRTPNIADIDILTLPRINESGFTERFMTKVNGQQAQFATWMASAKEVTSRPNAVAFISEGGMTSAIARVVNTDLVRLFVKGPSPQVTELGKGEVFLQQNPPDGGPPRFLTTDQTSEAEKLILHGFIPGATNDADKTLFPLQHTFELESDHVHGMIGVGALKIIDNLPL